MDWIDKLERRFGGLAVPGLTRYLSMAMLSVFFLQKTDTIGFERLMMSYEAVIDGQIWRLFTFLLIPMSTNPFFLLFELMILVMVGDGLERHWGSFKLTLYYLVGAVATALSAMLIGGYIADSRLIYQSMFFAFATVFPNYELLLFFILPVKVKYLALFSAFWIVWTVAVAPLEIKVAALLTVANYLLFFGRTGVDTIIRNKKAYQRRKSFEESFRSGDEPRHRCSVCQRTEKSNPELQFRYCTCDQCEGGTAFCLEHLADHKNRIVQAAGEET